MSNQGVDVTTYAGNTIADVTALGLLMFLVTKDKSTLEMANKTMHSMLASIYQDDRAPEALKNQIRTRIDSITEIALQQCK
ncbi:hypothetical protein [Bordetella genomosp. 13]|uniref:Uncharacterized protein n=1 Tax=Bordetella genomosp. 13 TaxID=463040 RepID=A0A1W6ZDW5_9BORD|nr:hypothetical protein [Bordetella genomosp. 13]ARP95044.1 hypothetical protein CAL15_12060 [Bordetella genomosp. 13]